MKSGEKTSKKTIKKTSENSLDILKINLKFQNNRFNSLLDSDNGASSIRRE